MKIGILYAGKTGTTEKCALELQKRLIDCELFNLVDKTPDIVDYDIIIIGSSVRIGRIHPHVKKFINQYKELLINKPFSIYLCQCLPEYQKIVDNNFPSWVKEKALTINSFKGELKLEKQKWLAKLMVKIIMKDPKFIVPEIDYSAIDSFASKIKSLKGVK